MRTTSIAQQILEQLGGNKFLAMTGAHTLGTSGSDLTFRLPRSARPRNGINFVTIAYRRIPDTYDVTFHKLGTGYSLESIVVRKVEGVQAPQLRSIFTDTTGLETSLGTMGAQQ